MIDPDAAAPLAETIDLFGDDLRWVTDLSDALNRDVEVFDADAQQACDENLVAQLPLPSGHIAVWKVSDREDRRRSLGNAKRLIEIEHLRRDRDRLKSESSALSAQVIQDFEELTLIRTLASTLEVSNTAVTVDEMIRTTLEPLRRTIDAESVVAWIGPLEGGHAFWCGTPIIEENTVRELIASHQDVAASDPLVSNQTSLNDNLREFVLVRCRSEGRTDGWVMACNRVESVDDPSTWGQVGFTTAEASLLSTVVNQLSTGLHNLRLLRQKEGLLTDIVLTLVKAIEARDPYTRGHSERVAKFGRVLALAIGLDSGEAERIYLSGLLHDVGKIAIPDDVLQKPGSLNESEREIIETHTDAGWQILHELGEMQGVLPGVLYHHERFGGGGYPDGLVGEAIPLDGRILAVCDAFDAMTSDRPYRVGMPSAKAFEILCDGAGTYWDPDLVRAFVRRGDAIERIRTDHQMRPAATRPRG